MRWNLVLASLIAVGAALVLAVSGGAVRAQDVDPPTLVWNNQVGSARLGMSEVQIEYLYGAPTKTDMWRLPHVDTPFPDAAVHAQKYVIGDHSLWVWYLGGRPGAKVLETSSPYYRTSTGVGVGTRIPLGQCVRTRLSSGGSYCAYKWRSFEFDRCSPGAWIGGYGRRQTVLIMQRGVVQSIMIGDPGVILHCY